MFHIQQFKVKNFKAFRESASVELKPLTVLAGVNSSGKSSFIQGLLLLKQSLDTESFPRLRLSGGAYELFVEFASLKEAIFRYAPPKSQPRFEIRVTGYMPEQACEFFKGELPQSVDDPNEGETGFPLTLDVEISFRYDEKWGAIVDYVDCQASSGFAIGPRLKTSPVPDAQDQVSFISAVGEWPEEWTSALDLVWSGVFPAEIYMPVFLDKLSDWAKNSRGNGVSEDIVRDAFSRVVNEANVIFNPLSWLSRELRHNFYYLESLRPRPRPIYRIDPNPPLTISAQGDISFQRLWYARDEPVQVVASGQKQSEAALTNALNRILVSLGIKQPLSIVPVETLGFQIQFQTIDGQEFVSIPHVGFGISQILPVLLICLEAKEGDTIIIDHPEIHLHPNAQALMADYFIELANSGRRLIVETHSHYFIKRLVRRVAERNELADKINVLFVRPPRGKKGATIAPVEVNQDGDISNWPPDFFPEPDEDTAKTLEARFLRGQQ